MQIQDVSWWQLVPFAFVSLIGGSTEGTCAEAASLGLEAAQPHGST